MTVTTSRGKTFEIDWMWGPMMNTGEMMLQLEDTRPMAEIAADFDGVRTFHRESELEGDRDYEGYTRIVSIARVSGGQQGRVQITFDRPEEG